MNILIIGALSAMTADPQISGTVISLKHLIAGLKTLPNLNVEVIDVGMIRKSRNMAGALLEILCHVWKKSRRADVITVHQSPDGFSVLCLPLLAIAKIRRKPLIYRMFGGKDVEELSWIKRSLIYSALRHYDRYLAQTKLLLNSAIQRGISQTCWFPTTRPVRPAGVKNPQTNRTNRVVFLAHIKRAKGIFELIEASDRLTGITRFDVYGPFYDGLNESIFEGHQNIKYHETVFPQDVDSVLIDAIALILPTYMVGEGYPGSVIEAFNAGLPVISTTWRSVPEIVDESCGILVEPRNAKALENAIRSLVQNPAKRRMLSEGAYQKRLAYDHNAAVERFMSICSDVVMNKKTNPGRLVAHANQSDNSSI